MKVNKVFYIDYEFTEELTNCNASLLVNSLLTEHFDDKNSLNLHKLKQKLSKNIEKKRVLLREIRDLRVKINKISEKEAKILRISKHFSKYLLNNLNNCENIIAFHQVWRSDEALKKYSWPDVKNLYNYLKGGVEK